jgi:hypothetical protein
MSEYQEFTGKSVEEALKLAREAFGADLNDLDFEILTPGSRGVLGWALSPRGSSRLRAPHSVALHPSARPLPPSRSRPRHRAKSVPATTARHAVMTGRATTGRHRRAGPRRVTARHVATTDPETTDRVVTARRVATTGRAAMIALRRPAADRRTCPPPRPPRSRPRAARWPLNEQTLKRPKPRPRRSPPARRSSSS